MSKRFKYVYDGFFSYIEDTKTGLIYCTTNHNDMKDLANLLHYQNQRIAELEEQLKNEIVPKFKIGQEVYVATTDNMDVIDSFVDYITIYEDTIYYSLTNGGDYKDYDLFATKEEAQAKLRELKG